MQDDELTPDEKSAYAALPREIPAPTGLEDRVTRAVMTSVAPPAPRPSSTPTPWQGALLRVAAAALIFFAGAAAGRATVSSPVPQGPPVATMNDGEPYLLTLYGGAPLAGKTPEELFEEYSQWAVELFDAGHLIASARLEPEREVFGNWDWVPTERLPVGFFYVRASTWDEARSIALESPHVRYGGAVELRGVTRR